MCKLGRSLIDSSYSLHITRMISSTQFHAIHKIVGQEMGSIGFQSESSWTLRYAYYYFLVCVFKVRDKYVKIVTKHIQIGSLVDVLSCTFFFRRLDSSRGLIQAMVAMLLVGAVRISGAFITGEGDMAMAVGGDVEEACRSSAGLHFNAL